MGYPYAFTFFFTKRRGTNKPAIESPLNLLPTVGEAVSEYRGSDNAPSDQTP
jgi:hypothetical protein